MQQSALKRQAFQAQSDRRIIKQMHQIGLIRRQGEYTIYLDPICAEYHHMGGSIRTSLDHRARTAFDPWL